MSWWITSDEATLTEQVPAVPSDVREFYVDPEKVKVVHPLVVSVRSLSCIETSDGYEQTYRVVDPIPLGMLNLRIRYRARLKVPVQGDVITEARQFPRVRLDSR